ncbi:unnamed protein product, partial [Staurois parvus]
QQCHPQVPPTGAQQCTHLCHSAVSPTCATLQCHTPVPRSATYLCPEVPPTCAQKCHPPVPTHLCHPPVQPGSAASQLPAVVPVSAASQCPAVMPVSAVYQYPSSVSHISAAYP